MQKAIAKIDLGAIRHNARYLKGRANGALFYAVVKADAYGHGAVQVARALNGIADGFCVAIVDEAVELRVSGITSPVLVLTPPLAVLVIAGGAALIALGVHLDKERQRWGGSVNPPLPPQR